MANSLPLLDQLKTTRTTLVIAHASYEIWWLYAGAETRPQYLNAMNRFANFFRYDEEAHLRILVVHLHMLFDKRRDAISLSGIIKLASIPDDKKKVLARRLSLLVQPTDKLKKLRDNLFAHRNRATSYEQAYATAQITPNEIVYVLQESIGIFNEFAAALDQPKFEPNPFVRDDTKALLEALESEP